ncbi:28S ribosomal protein S7, mitochondrial [Cimex lectularius]|uniref:Small ribosomal subunit protein uS7 domain-containing protein n=1 Tax=Cimex lectularius TaxID=79782 RepID=A0A8I6SBI2_CIMLE|nr:28S ribosomal protein S7, mitochondrial [Cimex lectularius]
MFKILRSLSLVSLQTRNVSYGPHFIEPIYRKSELEKLKESEKAKELLHVPVKAAKIEQSCSPFYDPVVEKFINYVMRCGKKDLARFLVNKSLESVKRIQLKRYHKTKDPDEKSKIIIDPLVIFHRAVENCKPLLKLTPIKRGGATYQVPVPITEKRSTFLAMNWLIEQGKADPKNGRFYDKLAQELLNASNNEGRVIKKKQDLHRQCEANKAYAHYRWG